MTLEFDVDIGYITDDGSKDMPQWVKLNDEDGQHPSTVYVNNDSYQRSISENAKLRELAGELWFYAEQELVCDDNCPYGNTCDWMEPTVVCVFRRRMRELGVEVDG